MNTQSTALIVGASRGLGLALAEEYCRRGWHVIATSRGPSTGLDTLARHYGYALEIMNVDINNLPSVQNLRTHLDHRSLDVLFINAGICKAHELNAAQVDERDYLDMLLTNALAPTRVLELFHDRVSPQGVVAVMSSELGSIANSNGFWQLYSSAARHPDDTRALLAIAPGWVRTDMGTQNAALSIEQSIPPVVDLVTRKAGVAGLSFVDRLGSELPW
jgi:NAD(P)-dependent dehydrogenase (short-subunit alcohol dehydrogenase family)